ncbi:MAG: ABC transporter permease [Nitrospinota bacterium]
MRISFSFKIGIGLTLLFFISAICAPLIAPYTPYEQNLYATLAPPTSLHIMGQDGLGRDILSRILYGSKISIIVGLTVVAISSVVGTIIGVVSALVGGREDQIIMRVTDMFLSFPGILLAIAVMASLGPGLINIIISLSIVGWTTFARLARSQALVVKEKEFVIAAIGLGASHGQVIFYHIIPNILAPIIVEASFAVAGAILAEAGLSFLGLGVQPPDPSWGMMLAEGRKFILIAPHLTIFPGLAIMFTVMGINFLGEGLRNILDPKREFIEKTL